MTAADRPSISTGQTVAPNGPTSAPLAATSLQAVGRSRLIAASGLVAAELAILAGNVNVPSGEKGGLVPAIVTSAVCLALGVALFGGVVSRRPGPGAALTLGILSLLSVAAFWSGVPLVLGSAAFAVTVRTDERTGQVRAAQVLAAIACVVALAANALGSHLL